MDNINSLRKYDEDSYKFYSKIGGQVLDSNTELEYEGLPASWKNGNIPSFGMIHLGMRHEKLEKNRLYAQLVYFKKVKNVWNVQRTNHSTLEVVVFYSDRKNRKYTVPIVYHVAIDNDNEVRMLLVKSPKKVFIKGKNGGCSYTVQKWQVPPDLAMLAADAEKYEKSTNTPESVAMYWLSIVANTIVNANSGVQVRATKGVNTACFSVDMLRTPYFFKDRDKTITVSGKAKKIFHIVRTHDRNLADGTVQHVKSHFRGERKFDWNGYKINITMPAKHHSDLLECTVEGFEVDIADNKMSNVVDMEGFGDILKRHVSN
jgi:hypothetical protein